MFEVIVVGTDGSETAGIAVQQAVELAAATGARLEIVSAYEPQSGHGDRDSGGAAATAAGSANACPQSLHRAPVMPSEAT